MKKRFLIPAVATAALTGLYIFGSNIQKTCVPGNADYEAGTGICNAKNAASDAVKKAAAEKAAEVKAANEKWRAERDAKQAAADAKFKAEGWWQQQPGIYARWCTNTCDNSKVIGSNRYSLLEVWAKDRAAGDIYARVNLIRNGVVIGWTNDTSYLSKGQRGVLTFDSYQSFDEAQLTEFSARG